MTLRGDVMTPAYSTVREGDLAPDFTLSTDAGKPLTLSSLRGKRVVLFFYPKDSSAGCSIEARQFADEVTRLRRAKTVVLGVSAGSVKAKAKFKASNALPYTLLADEQAEVAQSFGVWREKMLYGHKYFGVMRTTYLLDAEGRVERLWENVAHEGHAAEVSAVIRGVALPPRSSAKAPRAKTKK